MSQSNVGLNFGFLGSNHQILETRNENDDPDSTHLLQSSETLHQNVINQYPQNSISRFLLKQILFSKKSGIFEVSYIPNISPIDIFMKNCDATDTIWISCHQQTYYIKEGVGFYIIRNIPELQYLLSKIPTKKVLIISHLSHIVTSHLLAALQHNKTTSNSIPSINDYKCKLLTRLFQQFISKFNKTILVNQFMNSKNNDFGIYMLKTELENGIIGKGSLDLVWQRLINYKFGIYNNSQQEGSMKVVMETGQSNGNMRIFTLYQNAEETNLHSEQNGENDEEAEQNVCLLQNDEPQRTQANTTDEEEIVHESQF